MINTVILIVLVCCCVNGFNTRTLEFRQRLSPLQQLYGLPALLPEEYNPVAIDKYFKDNPTLAFQRAGVLVSQFMLLMIECIGEIVMPPLERRDIHDDEQLEDFPSMQLSDISNAEYPPRLVDSMLGYNYMAVNGYGNEGKVEKSNKFSLLARCAAKLRRTLVGLGPCFIKIAQVKVIRSVIDSNWDHDIICMFLYMIQSG